MTVEDYLKFLFALIFVLALMGGLAFVLKKLGLAGDKLPGGDKRRLKVLESLPLDARRKVILLRKDDTEHLVILGPTGETVLDRTKASDNKDSNTPTPSS
jgi:flagellar protein FliO/FliZ